MPYRPNITPPSVAARPLLWAVGLWVAGAVLLGVADIYLPTGGREGWALLPSTKLWATLSAIWISLGAGRSPDGVQPGEESLIQAANAHCLRGHIHQVTVRLLDWGSGRRAPGR